MQGATIDELRELSHRSRRAQRSGFLSLILLLALVPVALMLPAWGVYAAFGAGGLGLVGYAYVVGQERGAFRRVFKRIREDQRATRSITPSGPEATIQVTTTK